MAKINNRTIEMLELKNRIDKLMEEYKASFYTQVDKDGHVSLIVGPTSCNKGLPENFIAMYNTKSKS